MDESRRERDFDQFPPPGPGLTLWSLGAPDPKLGWWAAFRLIRMAREDDLSKLDAIDGLKHVVESEWEALGAYGRHLVAPLAEILRTDPSLVRIEIVAFALALQGEDGIAELLGLLGSDDFVLRHKSIIGISILDGRARWVVPRLLQVLGKESQPLIVVNIIDALGRIAGPDAIAALENMYRRAREEPGATKDLLEALERALSTASAQA